VSKPKLLGDLVPYAGIGTVEEPTLCSWECSLCYGLGYVSYAHPVGHPEFGRIVPCPNRKMSKSVRGLSEDERGLKWENVLKIDGQNTQNAVTAAKAVLERGFGWLFVYGLHGLGKTLTMKIAAAEASRTGSDCIYTTMPAVLDNLKLAFDGNDYKAEKLLDRWQGVELLVIDEMDKLNSTPWAQERRFIILENRYVQNVERKQGITLMASNEPPAKLPAWLQDRVEDNRVKRVHLQGLSMRPSLNWTANA